MKLKKGDYISAGGFTLDQIKNVVREFAQAGFSTEYCERTEDTLFLGVDTEGEIYWFTNPELYGTDRRELTYDQIVSVPRDAFIGVNSKGEGISCDGFMNLNTDPEPLVFCDTDNVNHPPHYTQHPSGVECIQITEHMGFNLGNAIKYVWRADLKNDAVEDLRKAVFYINREISKRNPES